MFLKWNIELLIIDSHEPEKIDAIDKIAEEISQANYGIVLVTPDNVVRSGGGLVQQYQLQPNIALGFVMLLAKLGMSKVAVLLKEPDGIKTPLDLNGLAYMPFKTSVRETSTRLIRELQKNGYIVDG